MEEHQNNEQEGGVQQTHLLEISSKVTDDAKLKELLRNLTSAELELCQDASKEFVKLLKSDTGRRFLHHYILNSSNCIELLQAWDQRKGKPGFFNVVNLISAIFNHPGGKSSVNGGKFDVGIVDSALDKLGRVIIEQKLGDLYKELNSKEGKCQNAVLSLLSSIVRRGSGLASEVARVFDFKNAAFSKLGEWRKKRKRGKFEGNRKSGSARKAFVGFAMSFLEVGSPRLLRGILQQREMFSGVLRGLGNDDEETAVYVLSTLRDRVLVPESMVPPGLRSVLFGNVTLEQLIGLSAREDRGLAAEVAHEVLLMVCTDPSNGLMPDLKRKPSPLTGNPKRILGLMRKLKATEVEYHGDLLLAIVKGKPSFGSAYLDDFPYSVEDLASPNWFGSVLLAANVVSSVSQGLDFGFLESYAQEPVTFENPDVQNIVKCIRPRTITVSVVTKGLQHSDFLVKSGTLKFLLESLKLLDSLIRASELHKCMVLKQVIQDKVHLWFPDAQVLRSLLSSMNNNLRSHSCSEGAIYPETTLDINTDQNKRLKIGNAEEEADILVVGVNSSPDMALSGHAERVVDEDVRDKSTKDSISTLIGQLWGLQRCSTMDKETNLEIYFYSNLLEALKIYRRTILTTLKGFDLFKVLPSNPSSLPVMLQKSLLSLLVEHVECSSKCELFQQQLYKHLHPFMNFLLFSPVKSIEDGAHILAREAMLSTGAFDKSPREIFSWFLFIPGFCRDVAGDVQVDTSERLSAVVVSFLCDAISTIGNNLFKYLDLLRCYVHDMEKVKDLSPDFSSFIICILEKCLRVLSSESASFSLPDKSMISLYVSSTLKYILETQVNARLLASIVTFLLSERFESRSCTVIYGDHCEWQPLRSLFLFARSILQQQTCIISQVLYPDSSFRNTVSEIDKILRTGYDGGPSALAIGFTFSMICTPPSNVVQNFPSVVAISKNLSEIPFPFLLSIFFLEQGYLSEVSKLWPDVFFSALERVLAGISGEIGLVEITIDIGMDSHEYVLAAFASFLKTAPFHVLFPAILRIDGPHLLKPLEVQNFLLASLSGRTPDYLISCFCHVLFWFDQAQSSYRKGPSLELENLSEACLALAELVLKLVLPGKTNSDSSPNESTLLLKPNVEEVAKIMLHHPAMTSLEFPLSSDKQFTDAIFIGSLEQFLESAKGIVHKMDCHVLNLLQAISNLPTLFYHGSSPLSAVDPKYKWVAKAFSNLTRKLLLVFKDRIQGCVKSSELKSLVPVLFAVHALISSLSPFELLEFVLWFLSRFDFKDNDSLSSFQNAVLSVGLHIAGHAFDFLSEYVWRSYSERAALDGFWGWEGRGSDIDLFVDVFYQVIEIATRFKLPVADACLLKASNVMKASYVIQDPHLLCVMTAQRVLVNTPIDFLSYCLFGISKTKSKLLYNITEISPLHLYTFGHLFSDMCRSNLVQESCDYSYSIEAFVLLLPTVVLYSKSAFAKYGSQFVRRFKKIVTFYWEVLYGVFSNWKSYVSRDIFEVDSCEILPTSVEEFLNLVSTNLLWKAILMMRQFFAFHGHNVKLEQLSLFDSVCPPLSAHKDLLDFDIGQVGIYSFKQTLDFVNRTVAKVHLGRVLLFAEHNQFHSLGTEDGFSLEISSEVSPNEIESRIRYWTMLVKSWQLIVKRFPQNVDSPKLTDGIISLMRFLEIFIARNIMDLTREMRDHLHSLNVIYQLAKLSLLHRFEDPVSLRMLRTVITSLSEGKSSCASVIQLLLAHSQFASVIQSASPDREQFGMVVSPMTSILRSYVVRHIGQSVIERTTCSRSSERHETQLELVKLLRVLFHNKQQQNFDAREYTGINSRELMFLLLSSYGATVREIDIEILNLMAEIESADESCIGSISEMDYLWGTAVWRVRKEYDQDVTGNFSNMIAVEERRKFLFRENIQIDPKICANTVLHFPYDRIVGQGDLNNLLRGDSEARYEENWTKKEIYDPVFILRLSFHSLLMGYVDPLEFAALGLLAVTFVSISSPDDAMRKLGYEVIGRFKNLLENFEKRKDVKRLRLLLSYLQNGIKEPWQRISSITAIFAAEASFVILDPSNDRYTTISKLLTSSPNANLKGIFQDSFCSSSSNFRADQWWMLRLLCAGLNTDEDGQLCIRNSIFEVLFVFYTSPLSDDESKELIIHMLKKCVKLQKLTQYLVEHCGLVAWLSYVISFTYEDQIKDQTTSTTRLAVILEVVKEVLLSRNTVEWLQNTALEQLAEISCHLRTLLVRNTELMKEHTALVNSILHIVISTLKISQKRKVYQPHFALSVEGLLILAETVDRCCSQKHGPTAELGLKAVLMSTPPVTILNLDEERLLKFVTWAISIAVQSVSTKMSQLHESNYHLAILSRKEQYEDSIVSKLLRWLTASVILGRLSAKLSKWDYACSFDRSDLYTMHSFIEYVENEHEEKRMQLGCEEILAATIFFLQQLTGFHGGLLPSVVSALWLLLFPVPCADLNIYPDHGVTLQSLCLNIRSPSEANISWRWSYEQAWKDASSEPTETEKIEEIHACERLLVVFSSVLAKKSSFTRFLSLNDIYKFCGSLWDKSILEQ